MTEGNIFYHEFMSAMQKKISHKATLANTITELLDIDKDAVYRRLRGKVDFSFTEMAMIARNLGISLDLIAGIENEQSKPARMNISRQVNPTEIDYEMFEGHVNLLKAIKDDPDTKIIECGTMFPHYLYQDYEYITRFYLFMWNRASRHGPGLPYHDITIPERLRLLQTETCAYARHIKSTQYVWDHKIFQHFVNNIKYAARIGLVKNENVALLKNDLMAFLENIEKMAIKGKHEETGQEVSIFIFDANCDTNYSCLKTKNIQLVLFRAFILNAIVSFEKDVFDETCAWISSLQRMSTLISVTGERARAIYFDTQRKMIDTL